MALGTQQSQNYFCTLWRIYMSFMSRWNERRRECIMHTLIRIKSFLFYLSNKYCLQRGKTALFPLHLFLQHCNWNCWHTHKLLCSFRDQSPIDFAHCEYFKSWLMSKNKNHNKLNCSMILWHKILRIHYCPSYRQNPPVDQFLKYNSANLIVNWFYSLDFFFVLFKKGGGEEEEENHNKI